MAHATAPARGRIGDRLERAIDEHAHVEREIARGETEHPARRRLIRRALLLALTCVSLYLVAPSLTDVLSSAGDAAGLGVSWLAAMAALQAAALGCLWALQHIALRVASWPAVITSQLAGNALAKVAPGGGALGAALQYRMLVRSGVERTAAVGALTAASLLTFAVVLALPVMAVPAIIGGAVHGTLLKATAAGAGVFVAVAAVGAASVASDRPLLTVGRLVQRVRNRLRRHAEPLTGLPARLLRERDRILAALGPRWKRALLATVGRWAFDYATLVAALAAVGSHPRPALMLLAFCTAQLLSQVPVTPGGVGFVEAGLTATLALAGVGARDAVLATFAYRLFSYWLPLPAGLAGFLVYRHRMGTVD
ncbi:MAG TPA: flippase-like domain-containing protein [Solirubrobacteraceae bacterium]|jgi:hypothetical protein